MLAANPTAIINCHHLSGAKANTSRNPGINVAQTVSIAGIDAPICNQAERLNTDHNGNQLRIYETQFSFNLTQPLTAYGHIISANAAIKKVIDEACRDPITLTR